METLERHLPISSSEELNKLKKIAVRFEEKIYTAAACRTDYLRKISSKMLSMEAKTKNAASINEPSVKPAGGNQCNVDPEMDGGSWRTVGQGDASADLPAGDWRTQLQPEARQRIVNKITETLERHLLVDSSEGLIELKKIAVRFEEKIYTAATSQTDYLRKISLKMFPLEAKTQNAASISPPSLNPAGGI
ncbi:Kix domain of CBP (creb binding protein) [Dioscorea alata]|nr:Kix domain of CBP (creb binding protein) [Dioscorea alata]KAH7662795.1 Kix domain of CBP (creb binding protein) [Dioscorea alata]